MIIQFKAVPILKSNRRQIKLYANDVLLTVIHFEIHDYGLLECAFSYKNTFYMVDSIKDVKDIELKTIKDIVTNMKKTVSNKLLKDNEYHHFLKIFDEILSVDKEIIIKSLFEVTSTIVYNITNQYRMVFKIILKGIYGISNKIVTIILSFDDTINNYIRISYEDNGEFSKRNIYQKDIDSFIKAFYKHISEDSVFKMNTIDDIYEEYLEKEFLKLI